ncbi:valine--tRNA ligase [Bdellovibrio svalbardensis]|uniref:Valine--tRNA ligase n=1 Tax=Bdellovibrio svalbardensis TaxID=2972972 RepID=A0ABT6DME4_9BACT|nr:valine--tRNA ligase [Bdellovibrio svalbardensis]MDG0817084.1 valine--tRNA ligase [Bdellovibrio svalbardensis]
MSENLSDRYNPADVENRTYQWWEESGFFKAQDQSTKPPFSIILPPPNVTGFLHMGHALDHTIQDMLIRWKRMNGFNTMWLPGTDHAGIATQSVVEKELKKQDVTRHDLGREKFVEKVWEWKHQYGNRIYSQMRRLGDSCDWDRAVFTLDEGASKAVRKVFVSLHQKGLIYRGQRLVNWSGPLETAISDLEVEHKQIKGTLFHINYALEDGSGFLTVATTRPETLLGDTAVAVNPEDDRYKHLIGKNVILPLLGRKIKIIGDTYVDKEFGSGVVKITPAHDFNDYKVGKSHNLDFINLLTKKAEMNENAGPYAGLKVQEARKRVVEDLKAHNLLVKEEPHVHSVGHCSRSGAVVEPFLSEQWFVKMEQLATPAKRVVESGTIRFEPESWTKVYLHWLNNIEDWCISRQLWWGHRIPVWYCNSCNHHTVSETDVTACEKCGSTDLKQDDDVLDTWFSSALWPFSTMGWPDETETLKTFYPTSYLVTGHDIIFFWVARMIMMGLEFKRDVPFRTVYIHGLVRDSQGRKMSKSLGNSIDPVEMIEKYGADALRFTFAAHLYSGKDFKFSEQRLEGYRNFMNKIWNAARFALSNLADFKVPSEGVKALPSKAHISVFDQWIITKLAEVTKEVEEAMEAEKFSDAANALYHFIWNQFCDWYIEFTKPIMNGTNAEEKAATQLVIAQVLNRITRLLHPFTPFISEEIYQKLPIKGQACIVDQFPNVRNDKDFLALGSEQAAFEIDLVKEVVSAIRNIRGENRISPAIKLNVRLGVTNDQVQKVLGNNRTALMTMARLENLEIGEEGNLQKCAVASVMVKDANVKVIIPLEGLVDFDEELKRINKTIEKLQKDISMLTAKLSNEKFVANAEEEVIAADRVLLAQSKVQLESLRDALTRFQ